MNTVIPIGLISRTMREPPINILVAPTMDQTRRALAQWDRGLLVLAPSSAHEEELRQRITDAGTADLPDEPCVIMQTSGTSGTGKLVVIPRAALDHSARATDEALGGPGNWACCLPTHHIAGFQTLARPALTGHKVFDAGHGSPEEIAALAASLPRGERTYLSVVPTQLHRLLDSPYAREAGAFSAILVGGASSDPGMLARAAEAGLTTFTTYGMTETCGGCAYNGIPIGDTSITTDQTGRISISGSVVSHGYLGQRPFGSTFVTNDAGSFTAGRLTVRGRLDRAITTGGLTVLPEPIETELEKMGAGEVAVVGIPDITWGEKLVAITTNPLTEPKEHLKPRLETVPQEFLTAANLGLSQLPHLESGKLDKSELARLARESVAGRIRPRG